MTTLQLPLSHSAPYTLLALGLFKNANIEWKEANELTEPVYGDVKGTEAVRAELEKDLPGKEVCLVCLTTDSSQPFSTSQISAGSNLLMNKGSSSTTTYSIRVKHTFPRSSESPGRYRRLLGLQVSFHSQETSKEAHAATEHISQAELSDSAML